jgi:hypothetical protein
LNEDYLNSLDSKKQTSKKKELGGKKLQSHRKAGNGKLMKGKPSQLILLEGEGKHEEEEEEIVDDRTWDSIEATAEPPTNQAKQ